jgi:tetratricopeptide (TPR) repeat protein
MAKAKKHLLAALKSDPNMAEAAYNLGVLAGEKNPEEAVRYCQKAHDLFPLDPKYAYTLAFYLHKKGNTTDAVVLLENTVRRMPGYADAVFLLGAIYEKEGKPEEAGRIYRNALQEGNFTGQQQQILKTKLDSLALQGGSS